jgi:hypothetical protein
VVNMTETTMDATLPLGLDEVIGIAERVENWELTIVDLTFGGKHFKFCGTVSGVTIDLEKKKWPEGKDGDYCIALKNSISGIVLEEVLQEETLKTEWPWSNLEHYLFW